MRVAFRTDASIELGNGHVMRCITLAAELRRHGAICTFICRMHPGHLAAKIRQHGFEVIELPVRAGANTLLSDNERMLGERRETDALQTMTALRERPDWLVVDHYSIGLDWETRLRPSCGRLMVIDDLANRPHDCDLLLDQNPGRRQHDYLHLLPSDCQILTGPSCALLRQEFASGRAASLCRARKELKEILVSMGGVDQANASSAVLAGLAHCELPADTSITVLLGPHAPWIDDVSKLAARMHRPTRVLVDASDIATLMAQCDIAIGAAGVSALERCCMGLPSIIIPVADNQQAGAKALAGMGCALLAELTPSGVPALAEAMRTLLAGETMRAMASASANIIDGAGAARVAAAMVAQTLPRLRPMEERDLAMVLDWRNTPAIQRRMLNPDSIAYDDHYAWFQRNRDNPDRQLMIAEALGQPIGFVQFSGLRDKEPAEWGFYKSPHAPQGSGSLLGQLALDHAFSVLGLSRLRGRVLPSNEASIRFHRKFGFHCLSQDEGMREGEPQLIFELSGEDWKTSQGIHA